MADRPANLIRGEVSLTLASGTYILRPSFEALVAAEEELGSLFALLERAAHGKLLLSEIVILFWHCVSSKPDDLDRDQYGNELMALGLAQLTPPLKILLKQMLAGSVPDDQTV
ncbi:MAG: gene transfer agent family protein [Parasphingorhabdus sp.]